MALGLFLLAKGRARTLGATLVSMGLSLSSLILLVAVSFGFSSLSGLAESPFLLLGVPLCIFVIALGVLLRRVGASMLASVLCAVAGFAGLYWLGGFVLMRSACGFHSGGC